MKLLVTGICGFAGSTISRALADTIPGLEILGVDNFLRPGSEGNRQELARRGVKLFHGDLRSRTDLDGLPAAEWVIDAAANPSVLAGVDGKTSSRQILEHNLWGTVNVLEYCKTHRAGLILLSTSRVYSIAPLAAAPVEVLQRAYHLREGTPLPPGLSRLGVAETFPTVPPVSLYGVTKLASEQLALEYGETYGLPVWVNRCGVLAGAGQFGKPDQGIFAYWINAHLRRRPLAYLGFSGQGCQVRDCLHPRDLAPLLARQMDASVTGKARVQNCSGGLANSMSLAQLTDWCDAHFGAHPVQGDPRPRQFDVPWLVLDSALARGQWGWEPKTSLEDILSEIADHARQHPEWLELSGT